MNTLRAAGLPTDIRELRMWVLSDALQVHNLGASLFHAVTGEVPASVFTFGAVADRLVLVAGALAGNALERGVPPTLVRLYRCGSDLILDIADHDTQMLPEFAGAQPAGAAGLGLQAAQRYALAVGWYVTESTRHIWARFPTGLL